MSTAICLAPARTLGYPQGGGHLWVYLQWALGLRALGFRVIWLEGIDPRDPEHDRRKKVATLKGRLEPYGLAESVALFSLNDEPLPLDVAERTLDLGAAAEADLLLNLWHSLPASVVSRFRRSAFVDTDPGLLQIWMTRGNVRVAPHHIYFTIGETVGTPAARFPDCGLRWHYTRPPVFLPEWPPISVDSTAPYTTVTHWWGSTFEFRGQTINEEKYVSFLEYKDLPSRTPVRLELAVCLVEHYEHWRTSLEPLGWKIREAWEVSATPEQYRAYIQRSRGEFSCAKPAYMTLANAWISDRTICYLASGKPAVVQHTGKSRFLPDADGLFRFRNVDEAVRALSAVEADYERHSRLARELAEEFDARHVVARALEQALAVSRADRPEAAAAAIGQSKQQAQGGHALEVAHHHRGRLRNESGHQPGHHRGRPRDAVAGGVGEMRKLRIGFLTRSFSPQTRSYIPLVMQALAEAGAIVNIIHPLAGATDLSNVRVDHDLYVLHQIDGFALSLAGALHAQGAAIVNPYPVILALRDKIVMFRVLQTAGVRTPATYVTSHPDKLAPLLEAGPLIVKPYQGTDGHGIRIIRSAAELADMPASKDPVLAQRYRPPQGRDRKIYSIGGQLFGVKKIFPARTEEEKHGEPFTPTPELCEIARRCGQAFGIDLYGVDIIESDGTPYVVDMNSFPGFKSVPDAPLRLAEYLYAAAGRAARGQPLFESAVPTEAVSTEVVR